MRRRFKKSKFLNLSLIGIVILISLFFLTIFKLDFFKVKAIDIKKDKVNCASENDLKEKSKVLGKNIFLLDEKNFIDNLKKDFICIKKIVLSKQIPQKITLDIKGREAVVKLVAIKDWEGSASALIDNISTPSASQIAEAYLVDDEAVIFAKEDNSYSPKIKELCCFTINIFKKDLSVDGKLADEYLANTLKILDQLKTLGVSSEMSMFNNLLITNSLPKIIFKLDGNVEVQIASLQLILEKAKIDNKELEFIDLRFDKPIVKFAPKKNGQR